LGGFLFDSSGKFLRNPSARPRAQISQGKKIQNSICWNAGLARGGQSKLDERELPGVVSIRA